MRGYAAIVGVFWQKRGFLPGRDNLGLSETRTAAIVLGSILCCRLLGQR